MTVQTIRDIDSFISVFAQQSVLFLFVIFVCGPAAQAQMFTVVHSSIGYHLGSSFSSDQTQPYTSQYLLGRGSKSRCMIRVQQIPLQIDFTTPKILRIQML
jgi:hypothetical protein